MATGAQVRSNPWSMNTGSFRCLVGCGGRIRSAMPYVLSRTRRAFYGIDAGDTIRFAHRQRCDATCGAAMRHC
jgi:hypothetical protein